VNWPGSSRLTAGTCSLVEEGIMRFRS
jgi:hypothetical protein